MVDLQSEEMEMQALAWLADFDLSCKEGLARRLEEELTPIWKAFPAAATPEVMQHDGEFLRYLRSLRVDNYGAVGTRFLLNWMGALEAPEELLDRAMQMIIQHKRNDPREDDNELKFGGPTRHKRVFSYAEYHLEASCLCVTPFEGAMIQENGARTERTEATPLKPVALPINERVVRTACSEFLLLSELCGVLEECGAGARERASVQGVLRLFSTGPSCLSCICAMWQFKSLFPQVVLEVSYAKTQATTLQLMQ